MSFKLISQRSLFFVSGLYPQGAGKQRRHPSRLRPNPQLSSLHIRRVLLWPILYAADLL